MAEARIARYAGLSAIAVMWAMVLGGYAATALEPLQYRYISYLWATSYMPYFSIGLLLSALLFLVFFFYLKRAYTLSPVFKVAYAALLAGAVIVAAVRYSPDPEIEYIHYAGAAILLGAVPVLLFTFALRNASRVAGEASFVLLLADLLVLAVGVPLILLPGAPTIVEPLSLAVMSLWVLLVTLQPSGS